MKTRLFFIIILLIAFALVLSACAQLKNSPYVIEIEDNFNKSISSKGENYNFLEDEFYMEEMSKLIDKIVASKLVLPEHIAIGNLTDNSVPELVVFLERDPNDINDKGKLQVYGYDGVKYKLFDEVSMSYDNTNYQMVIGNISNDQTGLLLNNQVGAHSGITYGFILQEQKLVSILNDKKINLLSTSTDNQIKDINGDGILEFSVLTNDPESIDESLADSDKLKLWYKWDGKDSGTLVKTERIPNSNSKIKKISNESTINKAEKLLEIDTSSFLNFLKENKEDLSPQDNDKLLKQYVLFLTENAQIESVKINNLFKENQLGLNQDFLLDKYSLSLERLNDIDYLSRKKVLITEENLKSNIISNLNLGYKLSFSEGIYKYRIDYQSILEAFRDNISREYRDYLRILTYNNDEVYLDKDNLQVSLDKLAERISMIEIFKMIYPYSDYITYIDTLYMEYIKTFVFGNSKHSNVEKDTLAISKDVKEAILNTIEKYPQSYFAEVLTRSIMDIEANGNKENDEINSKFIEAFQ